MGFDRERDLRGCSRTRSTPGAHAAWQLLGDDEIARIVDESLRVYGGGVRGAGRDQDDEPDDRGAARQRRSGALGEGAEHAQRQQLAARPRDGLPLRGALPRPAVRLRLQHQPLHRLPELHHGLQVHLDLHQGPGAHVVEQRRDQALRRLPADWDAKILEMLEEANPGRADLVGKRRPRSKSKPYGTFDGKTIFEAAQRTLTPDSARVLGYLPDRRGVELAEHLRGQPGGPEGGPQQARRDGRAAARAQHLVLLPGPHLQPLLLSRPAWPPARARRSTSGPRTASCSSTRSECRGYRKCVEACPYKKTMYRGNTRTQREVHRLLPARRGQRPARAAASRWRRAAWPPASARSACRGWCKIDRGRHLGGGPAEPALLPGPRGQGRAAALSAVRHRAERLLHPAALGAARRTCARCSAPASTRAIERYTDPDRELLAVLQLFRRSNRIIFRYEIEGRAEGLRGRRSTASRSRSTTTP